MGCYRGGLSPWDALHSVGCTLHLTPAKTQKKKKKMYGWLPVPALLLHHVFHVGPFSWVMSVRWMVATGPRKREGRCRSAHLTGLPGTRPWWFFPATLGLILLGSIPHFLSVLNVGGASCPPGARGFRWEGAAYFLLCLLSPGFCFCPEWGIGFFRSGWKPHIL